MISRTTTLAITIVTCNGILWSNYMDSVMGGDANAKVSVQELFKIDDYAILDSFGKSLATLPPENRKEVVASLKTHLDSRKEVPMKTPLDMAVKSRVELGKMRWHGHGVLLRQDVLSEGGRCAWALEKIMNVDLPALEFGLSEAEYLKRVREIRFYMQEPTDD